MREVVKGKKLLTVCFVTFKEIYFQFILFLWTALIKSDISSSPLPPTLRTAVAKADVPSSPLPSSLRAKVVKQDALSSPLSTTSRTASAKPDVPLPLSLDLDYSPQKVRKQIREQISGAKGFAFNEDLLENESRSVSARRTRMQISQSGAKGFGFQN